MERMNSEEKIQELLGNYLKISSTTNNSQPHLDEDSLNSFVEGSLNRMESSAVVNHLSRCSFCLHVTAELARLEEEFAADKIPARPGQPKPEKISEVLSGLLSKIFGTSDSAVFAHQEEKEDPEKEK